MRRRPRVLVSLAALLGATWAAAAQTTASRSVVDETGRSVVAPVAAQRIVSLAPNLTETVYALGAEGRLVGVTDYCDYPPEAQAKTHVGAPINPSLEAIVALRPDLVLATTAINRRETVESLERVGLAVYATSPRTVQGVLDSVEHLARLMGAQQQGEIVVAGLQARLGGLRERLKGLVAKRVLFVVWQEPLITIGQHTFLADALRWAGAESVVQTPQDWPHVSLEEVVRLQPEYLIFASNHTESGAQEFSGLHERPGWRDLTAVRDGHIAVVSDAIDRPAPRLVDAIEQLARQLHPEAFTGGKENRKEKMENGPGGGAPRQSPINHPGLSLLNQMGNRKERIESAYAGAKAMENGEARGEVSGQLGVVGSDSLFSDFNLLPSAVDLQAAREVR